MSFKQAKQVIKQERIKNFLELSESLNDVYMVNRERLSDEWIKFNTDLGKSIVELYKFSFDLYKEYNLTYKEARFYSFYFDFLVSKPSNSIFTETPKEAKLDLFTRSSKKIALLAEHLFNLKKSNAIDIKNNNVFNKHFQELFTNIFSYLDFIFYEDRGVFSKFNTNKDLFILQKQHIEALLDGKDDLSSIKQILQNLHIDNIKISTNYHKKITNNKDDTTKQIFENFVNYQAKKENDPIVFEIFSYVLSNKLWKFIKIIQRQPEYKDSTILVKIQKIFVKKILGYIEDYLKVTSSFYNTDISLHEYYLEIHKIDYKFINNYLFKEVLTDITNQTNNISSINYNKKFWKKEKKITSEELIKVLKPIIDNKSNEKFKLYRLIRKAKSHDISLLIDILHQNILIKNDNKLDNIEYIGILRSGSFLAHSLNILKCYENDNLNTRVVSLLTHPYLSILPRTFSFRESGEEEKKFIYIDEAIKSGYGLSISDIYRNKILTLNKINKSKNDSAIAIANMIEYDKGNPLNNIKYYTIIDVVRTEDKKELYFKNNVDIINIKKQFNWIEFINNLKGISGMDLNQYATVERQFDKNKVEQLDVTRIISDSILLFKIASHMADSLNRKTKGFKNILFYSGSTEGNLLIDTLSFVYKIKFKDDKEFYINAKTIKDNEGINLENYKTIFVDITKDSGYTQSNVYNLDVNTKLKNSKGIFDLSLFIFARKGSCFFDTDTYINEIGI